MLPTNRIPTHPGEILLEEFLRPAGIAQNDFAASLGISAQRVNEIIRGKRGVTAETAWLLAEALRTTPDFWANLQSAHDLARAKERLARIQPPRPRIRKQRVSYLKVRQVRARTARPARLPVLAAKVTTTPKASGLRKRK
jgi:addiction module HigA family antidote